MFTRLAVAAASALALGLLSGGAAHASTPSAASTSVQAVGIDDLVGDVVEDLLDGVEGIIGAL
ncbi:hypothetical protein AB0M97_29370 [Streptomyces sp. NPDC051207]|uniref:hypothetical protein n=1 Tax=Streptomyces sp. NPDC051207 TaxID=3154641 RepID=UPI003428A6C0